MSATPQSESAPPRVTTHKGGYLVTTPQGLGPEIQEKNIVRRYYRNSGEYETAREHSWCPGCRDCWDSILEVEI